MLIALNHWKQSLHAPPYTRGESPCSWEVVCSVWWTLFLQGFELMSFNSRPEIVAIFICIFHLWITVTHFTITYLLYKRKVETRCVFICEWPVVPSLTLVLFYVSISTLVVSNDNCQPLVWLKRAAEEKEENIGNTVGYQTCLESKKSSTQLLFCKTVILLQRQFLMFLRDFLPVRPNLKVTLMTATINASLFSGYFGQESIVDSSSNISNKTALLGVHSG
jgi:hypothetical protein